jgi:hypothetical protein
MAFPYIKRRFLLFSLCKISSQNCLYFIRLTVYNCDKIICRRPVLSTTNPTPPDLGSKAGDSGGKNIHKIQEFSVTET